MNQIDNPDFVVTSSNLFCPGDTICQWLYNKPKYKKNGQPETRRRKIGYIVAGKDEAGVIQLGWSKCASHDSFNAQLAREIAFGRLMAGTNTPFPGIFKNFMPEFTLRCKKYFQTDLVQETEFYTNPINWDQQ
jgi:hypothetical protein